ncbi:HAD family hydrolase [Bdellovibrio sp. HCB337]|uniref:HAD family hydrolase n=1 Tax=Bdellovibrio sp. HCB337 TaxID=3394358 RepID=UPI0039A44109
MKYKAYSKEIWDRIHAALDYALAKDAEPVAAFDADGTLWDTDLGEGFFQHQIDNKLVNLPSDPWAHYEELKKKDPTEAYLWLAQILNGQKLQTVQEWAENAVKAQAPIPVFEEQKKIIELFKSKGVRVYVVTASIKWAVDPGAKLLGLEPKNVIGIETHVENELITQNQKGIITYQMGKVEALLEHTDGKKPFFASGNTMGDFQLLNSATDLAMAVSAANQDDRLFKTENDLQKIATQKSWVHHRFI